MTDIIYTYIRINHYKSFSIIILIYKISTLSTNYHIIYQLSNHHYIIPHILFFIKQEGNPPTDFYFIL
jgi:hypothetical protein